MKSPSKKANDSAAKAEREALELSKPECLKNLDYSENPDGIPSGLEPILRLIEDTQPKKAMHSRYRYERRAQQNKAQQKSSN